MTNNTRKQNSNHFQSSAMTTTTLMMTDQNEPQKRYKRTVCAANSQCCGSVYLVLNWTTKTADTKQHTPKRKPKHVDNDYDDGDDVIRCVTSKRNGQNQSCVVARFVLYWALAVEYKNFAVFFRVVRVNFI